MLITYLFASAIIFFRLCRVCLENTLVDTHRSIDASYLISWPFLAFVSCSIRRGGNCWEGHFVVGLENALGGVCSRDLDEKIANRAL